MNVHQARIRAEIMKAMGHPVRVLLVDALAAGERCVCELQPLVDIDQSGLSRHLAILKRAGILSDRREGMKVFYRLETPCILKALACASEVVETASASGAFGESALPASPGRARSPSAPSSSSPPDGAFGESALPSSSHAILSNIDNAVIRASRPLPQRRRLPHTVPPWVPRGARHFITIACARRGENTLCQPAIAQALFASANHYQVEGRWFIWLMLLMPDHLHLIATFERQTGIKRTVSQWKRYQATHLHIDWQRDFFEHRLRNDAEWNEKTHYIRMNPVRKGLIELPEAWAYVMQAKRGAFRLRPASGGHVGESALPKPPGRACSPTCPPEAGRRRNAPRSISTPRGV